MNKMNPEMLDEFKSKLRKVIKNPEIRQFPKIAGHCPSPSLCVCNEKLDLLCPDCPLRNDTACFLGLIRDIRKDYLFERIDEKTALAKLVLMSIKLLAYLESKE